MCMPKPRGSLICAIIGWLITRLLITMVLSSFAHVIIQ